MRSAVPNAYKVPLRPGYHLTKFQLQKHMHNHDHLDAQNDQNYAQWNATQSTKFWQQFDRPGGRLNHNKVTDKPFDPLLITHWIWAAVRQGRSPAYWGYPLKANLPHVWKIWAAIGQARRPAYNAQHKHKSPIAVSAKCTWTQKFEHRLDSPGGRLTTGVTLIAAPEYHTQHSAKFWHGFAGPVGRLTHDKHNQIPVHIQVYCWKNFCMALPGP